MTLSPSTTGPHDVPYPASPPIDHFCNPPPSPPMEHHRSPPPPPSPPTENHRSPPPPPSLEHHRSPPPQSPINNPISPYKEASPHILTPSPLQDHAQIPTLEATKKSHDVPRKWKFPIPKLVSPYESKKKPKHAGRLKFLSGIGNTRKSVSFTSD